jgi:hypothetical protein
VAVSAGRHQAAFSGLNGSAKRGGRNVLDEKRCRVGLPALTSREEGKEILLDIHNCLQITDNFGLTSRARQTQGLNRSTVYFTLFQNPEHIFMWHAPTWIPTL